MLKWSLNYNKVAWKIFTRSGDPFSIQWLRTDVGIARCCGDSVNWLKPPWLAGSESSVRLLGLDHFSPGLEWSAVIPLHPRHSLKSEWRHVYCQTHRLWSGPQPENPWKHSRSFIYKSFCKNHGMAFPLFLQWWSIQFSSFLRWSSRYNWEYNWENTRQVEKAPISGWC